LLPTVICGGDPIAVGATAPAITITVIAPQTPGTITNTAAVLSQNDPNPANDFDSEDTTVQAPPSAAADLSLTKTDSQDPVVTGANFNYILSITNAGPGDASSVEVTDPLPAGINFVSATGRNWSCAILLRTVTCTRGSLASGATAPDITIRVAAPGSPGRITNTAEVSAAEIDPTPANNSDSEHTSVEAVSAGGAGRPGDNPDVKGSILHPARRPTLAFTGAVIDLFVMIGLLLMVSGSLITYSSRRREHLKR
jgi:uncharacterized repeat protein (TIGR01451 family)